MYNLILDHFIFNGGAISVNESWYKILIFFIHFKRLSENRFSRLKRTKIINVFP